MIKGYPYFRKPPNQYPGFQDPANPIHPGVPQPGMIRKMLPFDWNVLGGGSGHAEGNQKPQVVALILIDTDSG